MTDDSPVPQRPTLTSVAAGAAASCPGEALVVRVADADDLACLADLPPERVAWIEVPMALAGRSELERFSVDVLLADLAAEAPLLYGLARARSPFLPRLSIPATSGLEEAAAIGMALGFPLRLLAVQPTADQVVELERTLERYLHDSKVTEPVEPFHSALMERIHGEASTLWEALEVDPACFKREPPLPGLEEPEAVASRLLGLAECGSCPARRWCAGWFKWPDPSFDCAHVRRLLASLEEAAQRLFDDLQEARELLPGGGAC